MRHSRRTAFAVLTLALAVAAVLAATLAGAATTTKAQVNLRNTSLGRILVDARGRTLYLFRADRHGTSACYGQCASFWPPLIATSAPKTGAGLKASLFGTTKRHDGKRQVTYAHHPLYRFAEDKAAGQVHGQGVNHFGGLWWVVSRSGAAITHTMAAPATTTTTTTTSTTTTTPGYGYP